MIIGAIKVLGWYAYKPFGKRVAPSTEKSTRIALYIVEVSTYILQQIKFAMAKETVDLK